MGLCVLGAELLPQTSPFADTAGWPVSLPHRNKQVMLGPR